MRRALRLAPILLALLLALPGCRQDEARIAEHMERGAAHQEEGKHEEAILEFRSVLQIEPNHAPARFALAKSHLAGGNLEAAYWELREGVRIDDSDMEVRLQLAELTSLGGELPDALAQVDSLLAEDPELVGLRNMVSAQLLRAQILDMMKKRVEALAAYEKAVEMDPNDFDAILLLASFHQRRGEMETAEPLFRRLVELEPGYEAYAALASFLARDPERDEEAERTYRLALDAADPDQRILALRTLASFYFSRNRTDEAETALQQALEERPDDLDLIYLLARFYLILGDKERADEMIELATKRRPDEVEPYLILARYRFRTGDREAALAALDAALKLDPESDAVRLERAERIVELGVHKGPRERIAEARVVVEEVLAKNQLPSEALALKGKLDLLEGRPQEAIRTLRQATHLRNDWAPLHFLLGSALFVEGSFPDARDSLTRALELDPALLEARHMLARVFGALGKHDLAVEEGRRVLTRRRRDNGMRMLVAQSLASQRLIDEALQELALIDEEQDTPETLYAYGRLHLAKGNVGEARRFFEEAHRLRPYSAGILERLMELDRREGRMSETVTRIETELKKDPKSSSLVFLRGLAAQMNGQAEAAEEHFREATRLDSNNVRAFASLAKLLQATNRGDEALVTYERALVSQPNSASLNLIVATLREMRGDTREAIEHYEKAVRLAPDMVAAKNDLANLLAEEEEDLDRALELAQEARALLPGHADTADTLGWVLYKKGMATAAVGYLQEAESLAGEGADLGSIRYHLALAYEASDRPRDALATIKRALDDLQPATETAALADDAAATAEPDWAANMRKMRFRLRGGLAAPRRDVVQ